MVCSQTSYSRASGSSLRGTWGTLGSMAAPGSCGLEGGSLGINHSGVDGSDLDRATEGGVGSKGSGMGRRKVVEAESVCSFLSGR